MTAVTTPASPVSPTPTVASAAARTGASRASIRGSSLLLAGQGVSKLANFAAHVLIVRVLSQSSFGAFAYALALAQLGARLADFGLHRAVSRFVPIDLEQERFGRAAGTV
ncbi:MAG: oligosaccharide flippase family protein, partial [Planctomycetes bacterium]|nr:oligosaccharide flippase family protein [Planctomycetota bacterium]